MTNEKQLITMFRALDELAQADLMTIAACMLELHPALIAAPVSAPVLRLVTSGAAAPQPTPALTLAAS
jgi:hypothetical protein